jgi:hypothetical protein
MEKMRKKKGFRMVFKEMAKPYFFRSKLLVMAELEFNAR